MNPRNDDVPSPWFEPFLFTGRGDATNKAPHFVMRCLAISKYTVSIKQIYNINKKKVDLINVQLRKRFEQRNVIICGAPTTKLPTMTTIQTFESYSRKQLLT